MDDTTTNNPVPIVPEEKIGDQEDVLTLKESDAELVRINDQRVTNAKAFYSKIRLRDRQDRNFSYLFGRENNNIDGLFKKKRYSDNVLFEIEATLKPLAMSKDPDILVYPGSETPEQTASAESLTRVLQHQINTRELKEIKGLAFKHLPVYFIGAVKYFWNPQKGKHGDFDFKIVQPQNLVIDHNAKGRDTAKMDFITEYVDVSIMELIMRFPNKKEELINKLVGEKKLAEGDGENQAKLATKIKITETWFKYYEKKSEGWTEISAVMWKYDDLVFKKMKNPNWDWEGETTYFSYDDKIEPQQIMDSMAQEMPIEGLRTDKIYHNYFENPEFPYILIGYDQWGTMAYDETSRIEQLIRMQENINIRGNQVRRMLDRAMGKHVFSTEANIKAEDLEEMNWENMDQAIVVDNDVNKTHKMIVADQPSAQMINDYSSTRQIMFQKSGVNAVTGEIQSNTATSNQIAREANFTRADDLVDATINYMSEQMARAIMQLIKLRYTEDHFVRLIGQEGKVVFEKINRDMIEDGMEVTITASGTDKIQAQNRAMDMAKLQLIDPLTFYEDIGARNAPERTKRLMTFMSNPAKYEAEYVMRLATPEEQDEALNGTQPPGAGADQAQMDIQMIMQGQMPPVPQAMEPEYLDALAAFLSSPEFAILPPEVQQIAQQFVAQVQQVAQQQAAQMQEQQMAPAQNFGQAKGAVNTNPQNPTPTNTEQIPVNPPAVPDGSPRG